MKILQKPIFSLTILTLAFLSNVGTGGAVPIEEWNKTYGGYSSDYVFSVQQISDGYIMAGYTGSYENSNGDAWLIKTDIDGNELWNMTYGGLFYDTIFSVQQTSDGGYILAGYTAENQENEDALLIKTDSNGNEVWSRTLGGKYDEKVNSVRQTLDGGYILAGLLYGNSNGDALLIKTDSNGNEQWYKTFGASDWEIFEIAEQTSDGGYILAGSTSSYGTIYSNDIWLVKIDKSGNEQWSKTYGGGRTDDAYFVQKTSDGGYIIVGGTYSYSTSYSCDVWLIKTDKSGNEQWNKTFGGAHDDCALSVQQTSDGGYILIGNTESYGTINPDYSDVWLIKTDKKGNEQWNKTFGGNYDDRGRSIQQTSDGGFILAGTTSSFGTSNGDAWLIKIGSADTSSKSSIKSAFDIEKPGEKSIPGFEILGAIFSIIIIILVMLKNKLTI